MASLQKRMSYHTKSEVNKGDNFVAIETMHRHSPVKQISDLCTFSRLSVEIPAIPKLSEKTRKPAVVE